MQAPPHPPPQPAAARAILVAHPWMGGGGSEATAMWALHALQDHAAVTFTTVSPVDWVRLNGSYGTRVSPEKVRLLPAPRLPGVRTGDRFAHWQRAFFERFCRRHAGRFDVCLSAYNPIRFGRPAIQLIGDFSFDEHSRREIYPDAHALHRPSLLRKAYLAAGEIIGRRTDRDIAGEGDMVVANSRWTAARLAGRFGLEAPPVLYPPSLAAPRNGGGARDPLGFVCMGRVAPVKELETIVAILDRVRAAGHAVTLDLLGAFGDDAYSHKIRRLASGREWIRTPGFLAPPEKEAVMAGRSYGIHACRAEAFGIAVAEMAAAGLVPFVPAEGGSGEVVGREELTYQDVEDAVAKILALLENPERLPGLRDGLRERVLRFRPETFVAGLLEIVRRFPGQTAGST